MFKICSGPDLGCWPHVMFREFGEAPTWATGKWFILAVQGGGRSVGGWVCLLSRPLTYLPSPQQSWHHAVLMSLWLRYKQTKVYSGQTANFAPEHHRRQRMCGLLWVWTGWKTLGELTDNRRMKIRVKHLITVKKKNKQIKKIIKNWKAPFHAKMTDPDFL